jgi:hypothetical protein
MKRLFPADFSLSVNRSVSKEEQLVKQELFQFITNEFLLMMNMAEVV